MCEPICEVVNRFFYSDHPLRTAPDVHFYHPKTPFPLGASPLLYVDTAPFHPWTALRVGTFSRYNLFHALLVRNIVLHLAEVGFLPPSGKSNDAVGAVAPYASQARLIQALLEDRLGDRAAGVAATVHRFQGNEKQAMVIDLTDSPGARLGRFLKAVRREEDGARLLNVAASRAKNHVILLGNFEYLWAKAPDDSIVRGLVDHFRQHGQALDLTDLLPLAERDWIDGLHRVLPDSFDFPEGAAGVFTEGTFYPAFQRDLARTRESVVIFSPFATGAGTGRWVDPLRIVISRGIRVHILTRPPEEWGGGATDEVNELVRALRDIGVTVDLRARMHEKIAILDGRILWHGSLNILSHRDTHESMLRIESPLACGQLARFVTAPTNRQNEAPGLDSIQNPECPTCAGPTVWNNGRFGVYFKCENTDCDGKLDFRRSSKFRPRSTAPQSIFFGPYPLPQVDLLLSTVPHLGHAVATLVGTYARSANIGFDWLAALIQRADDNEAWIGFAYQGSEEASWIKDNHPTKLPVVARAALITAPKKVIPKLLSNAIDDERPLNASPDHALRLISEWVLSGMPGTNEPVSRRRTLLQALLKWSDEPRKIDVTLKAFEYVMAPNFQEHSSDPGSGMRFRIRNAFLLKGEWHSDPSGTVRESIREEWRSAVIESVIDNYSLHDIVEREPSLAHDWIQARIRDQSDVIWRKEKLVSSAISRLSRDQRTDILGIADQALGSAKLIRLLVGDDPHLA